MRKYLVGDTEAVRPYQPIVLLDAPTVCYMTAGNLLAVGGTTQHEPLKGKQLGLGRQLNFCLATEASPIEYDCFLREPRELRELERLQPRRDSRGLVQCPIDPFGRL